MRVNNIKREFNKGLWEVNPLMRQLLGMCSTLAITTTVMNAIFMGLGVMFVLICSAFFVSLIRKIVPQEVRIAVYAVIIATFVTIVDIFFKAKFPLVSKALGPYVPLIIVNCIILGRCEGFSSRNSILVSVLDGLGMGLGYSWVILVLAILREILGSGKLLGISILPNSYNPLIVMVLPAGAFLILGLLLAIMNSIDIKRKG
ncbi:MAG: electron transport complex subunit RsxE [Candidatus Omnitrophica bacterium]|nr:electron transport complex subunit RsxE [Candidatus Omnitrophota bacterium]MCM8826009.1 electron transport complex subunit RsxE [Candidatus Omnitrophota bacterium]